MKTLVFCTGYAENLEVWETRYSSWINSIESGDLNVDTILISDDGSLVLPTWPGVAILNEPELPDNELLDRGVIYHFNDNLGRPGFYDYPGWFRSFMFAAKYAEKYNYEKVIHIESDAVVVSNRLQTYLNNFTEGWETFWCPCHRIPETSIQVIAGTALKNYFDLANEPYSKFTGRPADPGTEQGDPWLPYTVNKNFIGDRYGEKNNVVPQDADYGCQLRPNTNYWWLTENG